MIISCVFAKRLRFPVAGQLLNEFEHQLHMQNMKHMKYFNDYFFDMTMYSMTVISIIYRPGAMGDSLKYFLK